ncbi:MULTISPECIES: class I SAM-dependent methyltransferase [Rhodobacterales]|uniref:Nodulation protein S (NodS) n=1 Tax=Roseivivax sediminis TaxID=936889 RepID=A0A1I1WP18_9RHOB|nr:MULTISPECIES: class I SAM-dependent methyltransferase [Rhodobacterales]MCA1334910.1 class I SAM-dependent methyltransferase [Pseudooceanicola marinus]SFD96927.1 Nodulation protein S (NodS) [Roseivivax sediminis]
MSWFQAVPQPSLDLIERHGGGNAASVIDIGGGASRLADALLASGYRDLSILDISESALARTRKRLASLADRVGFIVADVTTWKPARHWDVWHDRAVMHFLVSESGQEAYRRAMLAATVPGSVAIIGTFAPDGPERCSGLPVRRWSADDLSDFFAPEFSLLDTRRHRHETPGGVTQNFEFAVLRRV